MRIAIDSQFAAKIEEELQKVNGKAEAFTIRYFTDLVSFAEDAEKKLEKSKLPKSERKGALVTVTPAGPAAKSYKYASKSTTVTLERGSRGWMLVDVFSSTVYPGQSSRVKMTITEAQRDIIAKKAVEDYFVKKTMVLERIGTVTNGIVEFGPPIETN